jgi:hydrogenase maturation factor HypF (carbamoyltransferase family)
VRRSSGSWARCSGRRRRWPWSSGSARPRLAPTGAEGFAIAPSRPGGERQTLVSPDTATCADCLRELADATDRRHRYPFVNCTNCGPRLRLLDRDGRETAEQPLAAAAALLRDGGVVAVKGLGGYHLAADAASEPAVAALRGRKHREDKPFAVMVPDLAAARTLCLVAEVEERLLAGPRRPIVLLRRRPGAAVAPGNRSLGLLLPYSPLHHLLLAEAARPLVLTSGNVSDEPIAYLDGDAARRLRGIADRFQVHDRGIHMRTDDSVVRAFRGRELPLRRSRGFVPQPLPLPWAFPRQVLACRAELKSTFCVAKGRHAFVSHHSGAARPSSLPDIREFVFRYLSETPLSPEGSAELRQAVLRALLDAASPDGGQIQVCFRVFPDGVEVDVLHGPATEAAAARLPRRSAPGRSTARSRSGSPGSSSVRGSPRRRRRASSASRSRR